jgi:hypothetical protein
MKNLLLGNIEVYKEPINWVVPGNSEDYSLDKDYSFILSHSSMNEYIEEKLGKGWRISNLKEIEYLTMCLLRDYDYYVPSTSLYIISETLESEDHFYRTFYSIAPFLSSSDLIEKPWIPGFFLGHNSRKKNFKIWPVKEI